MAIAPSRRTQLRTKRSVQLIGLVVVSAVVTGGALEAYRANVAVPLARLDAAPPFGRRVRVACTADIVDPGLAIGDADADAGDLQHVSLCALGARSLVVLSDGAVRTRALDGKLQATSDDALWIGPLHEHAREFGAIEDAAYLDLTTSGEDRVVLGLVIALGAGGLAGWGLFVRRAWRDRRRRLAA